MTEGKRHGHYFINGKCVRCGRPEPLPRELLCPNCSLSSRNARIITDGGGDKLKACPHDGYIFDWRLTN